MYLIAILIIEMYHKKKIVHDPKHILQ